MVNLSYKANLCANQGVGADGQRFVSNTWEVNLIQSGNPLHIVVNDSPYCYWNSAFKHNILASETLYQELLSLINTAQ